MKKIALLPLVLMLVSSTGLKAPSAPEAGVELIQDFKELEKSVIKFQIYVQMANHDRDSVATE